MLTTVGLNQQDVSLVVESARKPSQEKNSHDVDQANQLAHRVLEGPNSEQTSSRPVSGKKLTAIKQGIQERKDQRLQIENECGKVLQITDNALVQTKNQIQSVECIKQGQKDIGQQVLIVYQNLQIAQRKAAILNQQQVALSQHIKLMQEMLEGAFFNRNLLFPRLKGPLLKVSEVKSDHEEIDKGFEKLDERSRMIRVNQAKLQMTIHALSQSNPILSSDVMGWIMNNKFLQNPIIKQKLDEILKGNLFFDDKVFDDKFFDDKFKEGWEKIEKGTEFISSYLWENLTSVASESMSWTVWAATRLCSFSQAPISTLGQWTWTYVNNSFSPITWIALGVFAVLLIKTLISTYPLISLVIGGYSLFVYINYNYGHGSEIPVR